MDRGCRTLREDGRQYPAITPMEESRDWFGYTEPIITEKNGNVFIYMAVGDGHVMLEFSDIDQTKSRELDCTLLVEWRMTGAPPDPFEARINMLSLSARDTFARQLAKAFPGDVPWVMVLSKGARHLKGFLDTIDPSVWIEDVKPEDEMYLFEPFLVRDAPNVIFGKGSSGKTYLTIRIAISLITGTPFLGFAPKERKRVLFLDFEASSGVFAKRFWNVMGADDLKHLDVAAVREAFRYYRVHGADLSSSARAIQKMVRDHDIGLIIIDSALPACGGGAEISDNVVRFFNVLMSFKTTSLVIAHVTKQENQKMPFGSAVWYNQPRNIWNVIADSDQDSDVIHTGFYHRKANDDRLRSQMPVRIFFGKGFVDVKPEWGRKRKSEMGLPDLIWHALKEGPKTKQEIIAAIRETKPDLDWSKAEDQISPRLTDGQSKDKWVNIDGTWQLKPKVA